MRGITATDLFYIAVGLGVTALAFAGDWGARPINWALGFVSIGLFAIGFMKSDDQRFYVSSLTWFMYFAVRKKYAKITGNGYKNIMDMIPYTGIKEGKFIDFGDYFGMVIRLTPIEFGLLDNAKQDMVVNSVANALRRLGNHQHGSIIRIERAMVLDRYIDTEIEKYAAVCKNLENGAISDAEMDAREIVFQERGLYLEYMNRESKVFTSAYYLVVYDRDKELLNQTINGMINSVSSGVVPIETELLEGRELAVFLRANYNRDFDERALKELPDTKIMNWVIPNKLEFTTTFSKINGQKRAGIKISDYPLEVGNAWGYTMFNMPGCRTVMNFHIVPKDEAEKIIDKAIIEMKTQMENSRKSSYQIERSTQLETITDLLVDLKTNNEALFDVTIHLTPEWDSRKEVRAKLKEEGFKFSDCKGRQVDSFISANISRLENFQRYVRGIPTTTVASAFPFISDALQDEKGICIGSNSYPVFIDFFKRNNSRVNSNMIVIGKSGSGKSFATKSIMAHLAADNTKIFVCDPEKEYTTMTERLHGNVIDVGNAGKGRFNPFHIYPAMLDDDDGGAEFDDTFESHLRFLESFFKIVMEGIRSDALEALNGLVAALYRQKGIDKYTDFARLEPEHFPVFQELFMLTKYYHENAKDDFAKINYRILVTYLEKFAEGGRYSGLWNGPASIRTNENFVTFNFMTLLANKNAVVANAQMLLVFKYLDGEIIKNRDYNVKYKTKRKIIIVVDEAHVFIDETKPIALDFMFNMAKRIRKYDGMQIIITQNVKDFVGSPQIAKKSAAIINASQYSLIFSLAPNDMTDLVTLYKNSGEINKTEQNQIVGNARGQAFFISGPMNRTLVSIETSDEIRALFE
jgi:hypothetical protein